MEQIKLFAKRLKNPTVVLSILSQVFMIFSLLNVSVDENMITGVITASLSILVTLGIMSNPDTATKTYGDDFMYCETCNKRTHHVVVGDKILCEECNQV